MNETELIKAMHSDFKSQHVGSFWRKIHGDQFMAGMPDVIAALPDVAALTEFKWCKEDKWLMMSFRDMVKHELTGLQAAELTLLSVLSETCPLRARVLIGFPVETDSANYEMACGFDMDDLSKYSTFSACDLASVAVAAREEDDDTVVPKDRWRWDPKLFPLGSPPGMEFQLRKTPSSEHWRAGALVLGMRRYKVFDVRTKIDMDIDYD